MNCSTFSNAKQPAIGICKNSPKIKVLMAICSYGYCGLLCYILRQIYTYRHLFPVPQVIENSLAMLYTTEKNSVERNTKLFASGLTTQSLRVTFMSVLDIITLLPDKDVRYVLTAKLNQDSLEVGIFKSQFGCSMWLPFFCNLHWHMFFSSRRFSGIARPFGSNEDPPYNRTLLPTIQAFESLCSIKHGDEKKLQ